MNGQRNTGSDLRRADRKIHYEYHPWQIQPFFLNEWTVHKQTLSLNMTYVYDILILCLLLSCALP